MAGARVVVVVVALVVVVATAVLVTDAMDVGGCVDVVAVDVVAVDVVALVAAGVSPGMVDGTAMFVATVI